jgi:hypothetical protein
MPLLLNIIVVFISIVLALVSIYMYSILSDTSLKDEGQNTKISPMSNWVLGIGITIVVLLVILVGMMLVNPELGSLLKSFGKIIGLVFGLGIFLIIIGWQLKAIETSSLTPKQKNTKYVGFTITIAAISGLIIGAFVGYFSNSFKTPIDCKPVPCSPIDCKPVPCSPIDCKPVPCITAVASKTVVTNPLASTPVASKTVEVELPVIRTDV